MKKRILLVVFSLVLDTDGSIMAEKEGGKDGNSNDD